MYKPTLQSNFVTISSIKPTNETETAYKWLLTAAERGGRSVPLQYYLVFEPDLDKFKPGDRIQLWWANVAGTILAFKMESDDVQKAQKQLTDMIDQLSREVEKGAKLAIDTAVKDGLRKGKATDTTGDTVTISPFKDDSELGRVFGTVQSVTYVFDKGHKPEDTRQQCICRLSDDTSYVYLIPAFITPPREGDQVHITYNEEESPGAGRTVTSICSFAPEGTSVDPLLDRKHMHEAVAVVQELKEQNWMVAPPGRFPWLIIVKHRTSGPKKYWLAFQPDTDKLLPNSLVRIFWLAKDDNRISKEAVALRIDPIGDVTYRDEA